MIIDTHSPVMPIATPGMHWLDRVAVAMSIGFGLPLEFAGSTKA
ncbi:hypothetical protein [Acidovorax sp. JHL-9]|nr:hypothetical protein [Acidovorax sp. JHL-9]